MLVAYNIPNRDCGQYSSGGAENDDEYRSFVQQMADGIGGNKAVVVLEPDALAQTLTKCEGQGEQGDREGLLAGAVKTLSGAGGEVYIDAGNPGFVTDTDQLADGLRKSGVDQAAGFALNVSNFQTNDAVESYGKKVSDAARRQEVHHRHQPQRQRLLQRARAAELVQPAGPGARHPADPRHRRLPGGRVPLDQGAGRLRRRLPRLAQRR